MEKLLIEMKAQPDDTTCGPTSLQAVYRYLGKQLTLEEVIGSVNCLTDGGTLGVFLGQDALRRGFKVRVYTYNLRIFDPTWSNLPREGLIEKLKLQTELRKGKKQLLAMEAYKGFLEMGGTVLFDDLNPGVISRYLDQNIPVLCGLSATYLYRSPREVVNARKQTVYNDLKGEPAGHFVVICGSARGQFYVADPYKENPLSEDHYYLVDHQRLINSIMLGVLTYDANLLIVENKEQDH